MAFSFLDTRGTFKNFEPMRAACALSSGPTHPVSQRVSSPPAPTSRKEERPQHSGLCFPLNQLKSIFHHFLQFFFFFFSKLVGEWFIDLLAFGVLFLVCCRFQCFSIHSILGIFLPSLPSFFPQTPVEYLLLPQLCIYPAFEEVGKEADTSL